MSPYVKFGPLRHPALYPGSIWTHLVTSGAIAVDVTRWSGPNFTHVVLIFYGNLYRVYYWDFHSKWGRQTSALVELFNLRMHLNGHQAPPPGPIEGCRVAHHPISTPQGVPPWATKALVRSILLWNS